MRALSPKTWSLVLVGFLAVLVLLNAVVWHFFTRDILTFEPWYNGGLDRLGYLPGSKHYRKPEFTLPRRHIENADHDGGQVDVVTVGDSFSNVTENGLNPLYQDWIASTYGLSVLNMQIIKGLDPYTTIIILMNSGYFDKIRPRFVVLQTVERFCPVQCSRPTDFTETRPLAEIEAFYRTARYRFDVPQVGFLNSGNFQFLVNAVLYRFSDRAFTSTVVARDLTRPFFSVKDGARLLFYHEDVRNIPYATAERMRALNDNLNELADRLARKGITLYFLPAPDKYNMYSEYIRDNPYPQSVFFETLAPLPKRYRYLDTKALLIRDIRSGEMDVYYADDTHWSWKASRKIADGMQLPRQTGSATANGARSGTREAAL